MKNILAVIMLVLVLLVHSGTVAIAQDSTGHHQKMEKTTKKESHHNHHEMKSTGKDDSLHERHKKNIDTKKENEKTTVEYTCPMHPEVKSAKPGKCPKCGMALVKAKMKETALEKKKMNLMMAGKYNCCIEDACDECLKAHGECQCKKAVKNNKPVCDECYQGWKEGKGDVSGKTFNDIKSGHKHNH